ncbi:MAG: aldose 1-epimerase family protein [Planctomycetaceae bacterium]
MSKLQHTLLSPELPWSHQKIQSGSCSIATRTLHGGTSEGVQVVDLYNGPLSLSILPTRGMGIWQGKFHDLPLGWKSPVTRPVHPAFVQLTARNGLGWLNGFNELLCRCGLATHGPPGNDAGEQVTLHGRIANLPAHQVELELDDAGSETLELRGVVDETTVFGNCYRLVSTLRTAAGSNRVAIIDDVTNLGARPAPLAMLYHINVGEPFLAAGSTVNVPSRDIAPRDAQAAASKLPWSQYAGPVAGFAEEVFFFAPLSDADGWCTTLLKTAANDAAFAVRFRTDSLPWFTLWKNTQGLEEGYVTGLEPGTGFPNYGSIERGHGRQPVLAPGQTIRFEMELIVADNSQDLARLQAAAAECQGTIPQTVHSSPLTQWP